MQNKLKILQIGSSDWSKELAIPDNMAWHYFFPNSNLAIKKVMEMDKIGKFDAILVDDLRRIPDLFMIEAKIIPYTAGATGACLPLLRATRRREDHRSTCPSQDDQLRESNRRGRSLQ